MRPSNPASIPDQMNQQIEYLRLHRDRRAFATQLATFGIERIVFKDELHRTASE
jgi:hypothetical protein